jgi:TorA maturation chaperone TorD
VNPTSAREREQHYRLLASLYLRPPSGALLRAIGDGSVLTASTGAPGDEDPGRRGEAAAPALDREDLMSEARGRPDLEEELEAEHTALFVLPSGVIPHEAFYADREQRLGGRATIAVEQFYQGAGIPILDRCVEMPDHLGVELEFMAALGKLEGDLEEARDPAALRRCVDLQRAFMEEHLSRWASECCENVIRHARYGFYKAIAQFTMEFLRSEQAHLRVCRAQGSHPCEPVQRT